MTLALSIISLVSLAITGALLIYVARLWREERERAEARVAALSAAIWREEVHPDRSPASDYRFLRKSDLPLTQGGDHDQPLDMTSMELPAVTSAPPVTETARRAEPARPTMTNYEFREGETRSLFADSVTDGRRTGPRRWVAPLIGVLILTTLVGVGTLATMNSDAASDASTAADERLHDAPLQLLSLRHQRDGESLTVSGVVKNPAGAPAQEHTDVVVFTFDRAGTYITSVRAALADPALAGGAESPFSVTIPNGATVTRYRISFRTGNRMLPHVDRRQDAAPGSTP